MDYQIKNSKYNFRF